MHRQHGRRTAAPAKERNDDTVQELSAQYEKKIYDLEQLLEISRSFSSTLEPSKLLESIVFSCMAQLRVSDAGIFVIGFLNSDIFQLETKNIIQDIAGDEKYQFSLTDPVVTLLGEEKMPVSLSYLAKKCPESPAMKIFRSLNPSLIVPLIQKNHVNGILFLGERFSFNPEDSVEYTDSEKDFIQQISVLSAIAINNSMLIERSSTDMMTELKLKYYFFNVLTEKLDLASVQKLPLSVIMFDIDFFKHFNDTYGHECGDFVLKQVAALIKSNLREQDLASRYGGEEFVVMLNETEKDDAIAVAERIRSCIEAYDFVFKEQHMRVTISCGVAVFDSEKNPLTVPKQLVNQADQGLYMSKHNGRNRVTYAPPSLVSGLEESE
ncbi:MAG: sensor domain-containing diguanylate cyclase [Treponemataceae bacterium]|nr:sensor domain-containing diguanylate cyclase [Treponemataceae bacterium]